VLAPLGVFRLGPEPCDSNSNSNSLQHLAQVVLPIESPRQPLTRPKSALLEADKLSSAHHHVVHVVHVLL